MDPSRTNDESAVERLQIRIHGDASLPALVYLPGLHGDWTLVTSFRLAVAGQARFVEFIYPRTLEWSLEDYADAIEAKLLEHGITHAWLLGESFGSQIVWPLSQAGRKFHTDGIILAGGFVKHPFHWGVCRARDFAGGVSLTWLTRFLFYYGKVARFRHRHAPEVAEGIHEFIARRTELDKEAATHRLRLIAANNPCKLARAVSAPVYFLSGVWDIIVPWPWVRGWLRRHCVSCRGVKILWKADHTVLATAPREAAQQVMAWMKAAG
jgi:pimeloyl-ACP methyl ester carboxylesterase